MRFAFIGKTELLKQPSHLVCRDLLLHVDLADLADSVICAALHVDLVVENTDYVYKLFFGLMILCHSLSLLPTPQQTTPQQRAYALESSAFLLS